MNKPVYVGMSVLDISKTLMYKFWCDFIKPKYLDRTKLCYTDTDIFITHIITEDFFEGIADDVTKWFDTSTMKMIKDFFQWVLRKKYMVFSKIN